MNIPFYRDRNEREYVTILNNPIHNHNDGGAMRPRVLSYCLLDDRCDCLHFLIWSRIWQEAVRYEVRYRVGDDDTYFIWRHSHKLFKISPEEHAKLYVKVLDCWKKHEPCRATGSDEYVVFVCLEKLKKFLVDCSCWSRCILAWSPTIV